MDKTEQQVTIVGVGTFRVDQELLLKIREQFLRNRDADQFIEMENSYFVQYQILNTSLVTVPLTMKGYAADYRYLYDQEWKADGTFVGNKFALNPTGYLRYEEEATCPLPDSLKSLLRELALKLGRDCIVSFQPTKSGSKVFVTFPAATADQTLADTVMNTLAALATSQI